MNEADLWEDLGMNVRRNRGIEWIRTLLLLTLLVGGLNGCRKREPAAPVEPNATAGDVAAAGGREPSDPLDAVAGLLGDSKEKIQKIVDGQNTFQPSFEQWWGRIAPDFALTDTEGNVHKLSSYRGKNVVVVYSTTWCPTCRIQVPHLKELREGVPAAQLAVLSISNESAALLKEYAGQQEINYPMLSSSETLEAPFSQVQYIPTSFFVDAQGKFKLVATGLVEADVAKAIVEVN
jgi:peroxiredoxin